MATWNTDNPKLTNQISADIPDIEENFQELHDVIEQITNGTLGTTAPASFAVDKISIYKTIYLPAKSFLPTTTGGAAAIANVELATNDIQIEYYAFDDAATENITVSMPMPEDWDRGTIKAKFFWIPATGCTAADTVEWQIAAVAVSDDDPIDATLGTEQVISDAVTAGVEADLHISGATPAITVSGTPALGDYVHFKVSRNHDGTDDMEEDAWLLGVWIQYLADEQVTAW